MGVTRFGIVTAALALVLVAAPAAGAQDVGDVVDLTCGPKVDGPFAASGAHTVSASGSYGCGTVRPSVGVIVCLQYNGVSVDCAQDVRNGAREAEASVSFPCLPGLWTVTAIGVATGGLPGGAAGVAVPIDCDPLSTP